MAISQVRPASGLEHLTFADFPSRRPIKGIIPTASAAAFLGGTLYFYSAQEIGIGDQLAWLIVFLAACIASIAGFAFSALAGSVLFHVTHDSIEAIQIMLVASIAIQTYSVWKLRRSIVPSLIGTLLRRGALDSIARRLPAVKHATPRLPGRAGRVLVAYGSYMLVRRPYRLKNNSLIGQLRLVPSGASRGNGSLPGCVHYDLVRRPRMGQGTAASHLSTVYSGHAAHRIARTGRSQTLETVRLEVLRHPALCPRGLDWTPHLREIEHRPVQQVGERIHCFLALCCQPGHSKFRTDHELITHRAL